MGLAELEPIASDDAAMSPQKIALRWISDQIYYRLLHSEEPLPGRDLLVALNGIATVGPKTLKIALENDPRIQRVERRWAVSPPEIDANRPIERSIAQLIQVAGQPIDVSSLGRMLAAAYPREEEALAELTIRLLSTGRDFFDAGDERAGLNDWLLKIVTDNADDVLFENFEETEELDGLKATAAQADLAHSRLADGAVRLLDIANKPVSNRALQFFLWEAKPDKFSAPNLFRLLHENKETHFVSPSHWFGPKYLRTLQGILDETEENAADVELTNDDVPKPITVEEADINGLAEGMTDTPIRVSELLAFQFPDLRPTDPNAPTTLASLEKALRSDDRFQWMGWDRWAAPQAAPDSAKVYPSELNPVVVDIEIAAGQQEDIELEDEGLEGTLIEDINDPLVKYGGSAERDEDGKIRCVVTIGHRQAGTLPVGDDSAVFPRQPDFLLVLTQDEAEETRHHWVNNELRLMYGLGEWYASVDLPASGGIYTLEPIDGPGGNYKIVFDGEMHPEVGLDANRVKDLLAIKERALVQETSTREIIQEILRHHSKGITFQKLYSEVIVSRMSSSRMIASILSSYYEFYTRGSLWLINERDAGKGFKKQKKKYIIKR
jgi:hypothetical protein